MRRDHLTRRRPARSRAAATIATAALASAGLLAVRPLSAASAGRPDRAKPAKIVFLYQRAKGHHPNEESVKLFARCLETSPSVKGVRCRLFERWPKDTGELAGASTVVIYTEGAWKNRPHPVLTGDRLRHLDGLMKRGCGAVFIHFALCAAEKVEMPFLIRWIGGYYNFESRPSSNRMSRHPVAYSPARHAHPVSRGWKALSLPHNETYFKLSFAQDKAVVPILKAPLVKAPKDAWENVVAWALERPEGGRGFGYSGGHFYDNWMNDDLRTMILNAIVWTAKIDVPKGGVKSTVPDELKPPTQAGKR